MAKDNEERCYLCLYANRVVEHEHELRKYFIRCFLDKLDHEPCDRCVAFIDYKEGYQRG